METYLVITDWESLKKYILEHISSYNQVHIGFLRYNNEIYIRSFSEDILKIIKKEYDINLCKMPNFLDANRKWEYLGNKRLFDLQGV